MSTFKKGLTSQTIVDESQPIDPTRLKKWLDEELLRNDEDRVCVTMLKDLVELADQAGFLNDIRQARIDGTVQEMTQGL